MLPFTIPETMFFCLLSVIVHDKKTRCLETKSFVILITALYVSRKVSGTS